MAQFFRYFRHMDSNDSFTSANSSSILRLSQKYHPPHPPPKALFYFLNAFQIHTPLSHHNGIRPLHSSSWIKHDVYHRALLRIANTVLAFMASAMLLYAAYMLNRTETPQPGKGPVNTWYAFPMLPRQALGCRPAIIVKKGCQKLCLLIVEHWRISVGYETINEDRDTLPYSISGYLPLHAHSRGGLCIVITTISPHDFGPCI